MALSALRKHGWDYSDWHLITDDEGKPLGRFKVPVQPYREELQTIKEFLVRINQTKEKSVSKTDRVNMVFLAGNLKADPAVYDNNTKALVDVGFKSSIAVSVYTGEKSEYLQLAEKLKRFRKGDFIQVRCIIRPYSVKKGEEWQDRISIDVTEIRNEPPQPQQNRNSARDNEREDRLPF